MKHVEVTVPDGQSGPWRVETFTITPEGAALHNLRCLRNRIERVVPGTYKRLMRGNTVVMSNTPMEVWTHQRLIQYAAGKVLLNGLGLGVGLAAILERGRVESVRAIELSEDVIRLVGPTFADDPRVTIVQAAAYTYQPARGERFDAVWHDIFDDISADNLPAMHRLHRKYGRRCTWQWSWGRELCERGR